MNCREMTAKIDLREKPSGLLGHLRYWWHLVVCRACMRYLRISKALGQAIRNADLTQPDLQRLQTALLKKYGRE